LKSSLVVGSVFFQKIKVFVNENKLKKNKKALNIYVGFTFDPYSELLD